MPDGSMVERTQGTPQGGVISPILANMHLHVVFDAWMQQHYADMEYGSVRWERYADDIIVHPNKEKPAKYLQSYQRTFCRLWTDPTPSL